MLPPVEPRPPISVHGARPASAHQCGVALIIVLSCLAILTVLVVAFLGQVTGELRSANSYSAGTSVNLLSRTAVNLVMGEINDATTDGAAWASQPGMIRTYTTSGVPSKYFKLYSAAAMTGAGGFNPFDNSNAVPASWYQNKALYTDLNEPVSITSGGNAVAVYPIVDGNNLKTDATTGAQVYDPTKPGVADVQGFSVKAAPVEVASTPNPVPMPVNWLYVLANGNVVAPTVKSAGIVNVAGGDQSPIVGRVAFWTDDESSKVNINTASEGAYMDTPRFNSAYDRSTLSKFQPVIREFQRYPGHPATTSLSTVLGQFTADDIYKIAPRVVGGGSNGGTTNTTSATTGVTPDGDRLYASVDELMFTPLLASSGSRNTNVSTANPAQMGRTLLAQARFFLTATSRAPDVNLYGKPRICLWPIPADTTKRSAYDQLIAFCTTVGRHTGSGSNPYLYHFIRQDPASATTDLPAVADTTGLGRNRMLFKYLQETTGQPIPGFGGDFQSKYTVSGIKDCDQILTEMFDYIRCTNLYDKQTTPYTPSLGANNLGIGQVIPIEDASLGTRGFGRFPTVSKAFLQFIGTADNSTNPSGTTAVAAGKLRVQTAFFVELFDPSLGVVCNYPKFKIRVTGLDQFQWGQTDDTRTAMGFPASSTLARGVTTAFGQENFAGGLIGFARFPYQKGFTGSSAYPFVSVAKDLDANGKISFAGGTVTVDLLSDDTAATVLQTLQIEFPGASFAAGNAFPMPKLAPSMVYDNADGNAANFRAFIASGKGGRLSSDGLGGGTYGPIAWILSTDVVRSVETAPSDMRLIASLKSVPKRVFQPHPNYFTASQMAHSLRNAQGIPYNGATSGKLANVTYSVANSSNNGLTSSTGLPYPRMTSPTWDCGNLALTAGGVATLCTTGVAAGKATPFATGDVPGDWDNGFGNVADGPFINKADEGDVASDAYFEVPLSYIKVNQTYFSANRQIPSAVMFGSLPTGVKVSEEALKNGDISKIRPWQTLLFRPSTAGHFGLGTPTTVGSLSPPYTTPPDYLWLDLFHMPVVEPYAISEPLSTAGRINMNYQVVPFTYITRSTGVRAVLKAEKVIAVPDTSPGQVNNYKADSGTQIPATTPLRQDINANETLKGFEQRFNPAGSGLTAAPDLFRSPAEICGIPLVPQDNTSTYAGMATFWSNYKATGDNSRERPYATIYPRLTTKSNTFTVHMRVQSLKKSVGGDAAVWDERRDSVLSEYRGSETVERYIDPNDSQIPDYANPADPNRTKSLDTFYRFRVVQTRQFSP